MNNKQKPCAGTGKAKDFGCEVETYDRKFGLCKSCLYDWSKTANGSEWYEKNKLKAKKKIESEKKKETKEKKEKLKTKTTYWTKVSQPIFNEIARLIDHEQPCIASGNKTGKRNGGHFHPTSSQKTISLNLHNIHIQSEYSNCYKSGDQFNYTAGLIREYGIQYFDFVAELKECPLLNISKLELEEVTDRARKIRNEIKKNPKKLTATERIQKRNEINLELGIYPDKFSNF